MSKGKYNKVLTVILIILLIAFLGIAGFFGYQFYKKYKIDKETSEILDEFDKLVVEVGNNENNTIQDPDDSQGNGGVGGFDTNSLYYRGYKVIGKIEMPSVNLRYPILDMMTNAKELDYSVAMQFGAGINKVGNTVIIGHNNNNGIFFSRNKNMKNGDVVYITDLDGNRIAYEIYNKYLTTGSDYSYANRNTNGAREITLVTCDRDGQNRLVICAKEIK